MGILERCTHEVKRWDEAWLGFLLCVLRGLRVSTAFLLFHLAFCWFRPSSTRPTAKRRVGGGWHRIRIVSRRQLGEFGALRLATDASERRPYRRCCAMAFNLNSAIETRRARSPRRNKREMGILERCTREVKRRDEAWFGFLLCVLRGLCVSTAFLLFHLAFWWFRPSSTRPTAKRRVGGGSNCIPQATWRIRGRFDSQRTPRRGVPTGAAAPWHST